MTFRWPWVSRQAYDDACGEARRMEMERDGAWYDVRAQREAYRADLTMQQQRYDDLVQSLLALKREGYAPAERPTVATPADDLPGKIDDAIDEVAQSQSEAARLRVLARRWLADGVENNEVRRRVFDGETVDVEGDV